MSKIFIIDSNNDIVLSIRTSKYPFGSQLFKINAKKVNLSSDQLINILTRRAGSYMELRIFLFASSLHLNFQLRFIHSLLNLI